MNQDRPLIVKSYLSSLPAHINGKEKVDALTFFAQGAAKCGDQATTTNSQSYEQCDVGAIIGNAFDANPAKVRLSHYKVRKMVMDTQRQQGRYWLSIDSNVFIYKDKTNPHRYLRYSFNGVFPATGIYCNENPGEENWQNIRQHYNMDLRPWRSDGGHIVICLQRPMGWSMRGANLMDWLKDTYIKIRKYSDRPIVLRWHPGDYKNIPKDFNINRFANTTLSPINKPLEQDLRKSWALICHNSTPSAVASIEGIPAFITDDPSYSQAGDIANTDFSLLENPNMPDRTQWIRKLAQCPWTFEDLKSGRQWAHMRQWVK